VSIIPSYAFERNGPVHFQPLELELKQLAPYFRGAVLNAGCGNRDITASLKRLGAASVTNIDIVSNIPGAIISSLDDLKLDSESFDTVFCNAVLEHVESIDAVMAELVRVTRPGGRLLIAIPFLQPYHESPRDFRRFTWEGMRQLGERHGLTTVALQPVHSIAQTLGWILWAHLLETDQRLLQRLWRPVIWLATRLCYKGNPKALRAANTFQAVYGKPPAAA
jgi:SAM-dependent methyltransferase